MSNWKILESEYLFREPWLTVRKERCLLPNGNIMRAYYTLEYPTWVTVFCLTEDQKVVLVKQYRHGLGVESIETPGGVVDEGEAPEDAVRRELLEETGYECGALEMLGRVCANPATTNNYMYMFLARDARKVAEQHLDATEELEVMVVEIDDVRAMLRDNKIVQALHSTCMFYALAHLGLRY